MQCPEWFELKKNETAEAFGVLVQSEVGPGFEAVGFRVQGLLGLRI